MKFLKRFTIGLLILIVLLAGSVFVVITFYKKELTSVFIETLKQNYGLTLKVERVRVSLISNWPHASVQLKNVQISSDKAEGSFINAGAIDLSFNMEKLLHRQFILQDVGIRNAEITLVKKTDGSKNFTLQRPADTTLKEDPIVFAVNRITIKESKLTYRNEERGQVIDISLVNNMIRMKDYTDGIEGSLTGKTIIRRLLFNPRRGEFLTNCKAELDLSVTYFKDTKTFCVHPPSVVEIKSHSYKVACILRLGEEKHIAMVIQSTGVNYYEAADLLTAKIRKVMSGFEVKNTLDVKAIIAAHIGKREDPVLIVDIYGRNNTLLIGNSKIPYSHLDFTGRIISLDTSLATGNIEKARVIFSPVKGNIYDFPFTASVTVTNLSNPQILIRANLVIEASKIKFRVMKDFKLAGSGVAKLRYYGPTDKLNYKEFLGPRMHLDASLYLNDFSYQEINRPYVYTVNGKATVGNRDLSFKNLGLKTDFGKATISGKADDFVNYVLGKTYGFRITLMAESDSLNMDPLFVKRDSTVMKKPDLPQKETDEYALESRVQAGEPNLSLFEFNVTLHSKKLAVRHVLAKNAKVDLYYKDNFLNIKSFHANACDGKINGRATLNDFRRFNVNVNITGVDVTELFRQFENFGQHAIESENLRGIIDVEARFKSYLDEKMAVRPETMDGEVSLKLKDGHIVNFEPIQNLSNFLFRNRNFNDVVFSEINESFLLKGYEMEIKALEINSNVLDLYVVNGVYNFKGNSNINVLVPWSNLKKRGRNYIPKNSGKSIEDTKGVKLNFAGPNKKMMISFGHK